MLRGWCGASAPPFMTTSTPTPWSSASTPWRRSSPSTSASSGCCQQESWSSSPTSWWRNSNQVRGWGHKMEGLAKTFHSVLIISWNNYTNKMNLRYIFPEVNIYEGGAALKGWNSVPVCIKHLQICLSKFVLYGSDLRVWQKHWHIYFLKGTSMKFTYSQFVP